jgi:hypothetical protein
VNLLDTAPWYGYGESERILGRCLRAAGVPRGAYYLSTKVGRYLPDLLEQFDFTYARTLRSVDESLARLQVDYIDTVQVHDPEFAPSLDIILSETLPALEAAERWVREPLSAHAHAANAAAKLAGQGTPAGLAAMAAFLAGDTIAPAHLPPLAPPAHGAGMAAAGAVRLAAARRQPIDPDALQRLLAVGHAVAAGSDSWRPVEDPA